MSSPETHSFFGSLLKRLTSNTTSGSAAGSVTALLSCVGNTSVGGGESSVASFYGHGRTQGGFGLCIQILSVLLHFHHDQKGGSVF